MIKLLGLFDCIAGLALLARLLGLVSGLDIMLLFAIYLFIKGAIFLFGFGDIGSLLDIFCAIVILSAVLIEISFIIVVATSLFLIIKGLMSLFS